MNRISSRDPELKGHLGDIKPTSQISTASITSQHITAPLPCAAKLETLEFTRMNIHYLLDHGKTYKAIGMATKSWGLQGENTRSLKSRELSG
jgi:hypothetical protein